ncbi:hypothetical protein DFR29_106100 [Tahibacter aquaticus]|uniref:Uncharacterized protein n=1 Tax=Tahibacter aquaticus TaxID=520092 RepID=A0A4R6YYL0_9GAMM|nr:hypothetical protein DFR29_106100 [Tahibacter aquaticus]
MKVFARLGIPSSVGLRRAAKSGVAAFAGLRRVARSEIPSFGVVRRGNASTLRCTWRLIPTYGLLFLAALALGGCVETRFESPLGDNIESCDVAWKGLWLPEEAPKGDTDASAFFVDHECRFHVLDQPERGAPLKQIHIPLNFVHDGSNDYIVVSDAQLKGLVKLGPPFAVDPRPEKSFFFARYALRGDRLDLYDVDSERVAKLILDAKIEGTISKTSTELHVYVRGNRGQMLEIVRAHAIFGSKPFSLRRSEQSVEAYEKALIARQRKE